MNRDHWHDSCLIKTCWWGLSMVHLFSTSCSTRIHCTCLPLGKLIRANLTKRELGGQKGVLTQYHLRPQPKKLPQEKNHQLQAPVGKKHIAFPTSDLLPSHSASKKLSPPRTLPFLQWTFVQNKHSNFLLLPHKITVPSFVCGTCLWLLL